MKPLPWLIAHRGAMAKAPENTEAAFDLAFSEAVDGIEFDVQLSADGIPVVFHDETLRRITGKQGTVADYRLEDLREMDFGAWFSKTFRGEGLLTLESLLDRYAGRGVLMVELKAGPGSQNRPEYRRRLCRATAEIIARMVPAGQYRGIFILSFDADMVDRTRTLGPLFNYIRNLRRAPSRRTLDSPVNQGLWGYGLSFRNLSAAVSRQCHDQGKRLAVYSCNTEAQASKAIELGADVVMTDDPANVSAHFSRLRAVAASESDIAGERRTAPPYNAGEEG